jgi:hypothetical protein
MRFIIVSFVCECDRRADVTSLSFDMFRSVKLIHYTDENYKRQDEHIKPK